MSETEPLSTALKLHFHLLLWTVFLLFMRKLFWIWFRGCVSSKSAFSFLSFLPSDLTHYSTRNSPLIIGEVTDLFSFLYNDFLFFLLYLVYGVLSLFYCTGKWPSHTHTHTNTHTCTYIYNIYIYIYILFLTLPSVMLHHKWLAIVPSAIQQDLIAYPFQMQ